MGKYKAIEECRDGCIILGSFNDSTLEYFEEQLQEYLNSRGQRKSYALIVQWWEGLIETEDLLEEYKEMLS